MHILIISRSYPPDIQVAARRWGLLVPELIHLGARCTIITSGEKSERDRIGEHNETIVVLPIGNQYTLNTSQPFLKTSGHFNLHSLIHSLKPTLMDRTTLIWERGFRNRKRDLISYAKTSDVIISSFPPAGPFLLGWRLSRLAKKPWVADLRDSFESKQRKLNFPARILSTFLQKICLKSAHSRITIGQNLASFLNRVYNISFNAIYNGWTDKDKLITEHITQSSCIKYIYYAGTIYANQIKSWQILIKSLTMIPNIFLQVRLLNDYSGKFMHFVQKEGLEHRVFLLRSTEHLTIQKELSGATAALVLGNLFPKNPWDSGTITGKLFQLLASGKPGIVIADPKSELAKITSKVPNWHCVHTTQDCINAIYHILQDTVSIIPPQGIQNFHVKLQAKKLFNILRDTTMNYKDGNR